MDINNENEFYSNQHIYSESKIVNFLEKTDYIENYYKIDFILFLKIYPQLNDNTKNKIIKKINMDYFVLLLKNNLLDIENILLNENIFEDIDLTIELLFNSNFLGKFLKLTDYDKFIKGTINCAYNSTLINIPSRMLLFYPILKYKGYDNWNIKDYTY